MRHVKDNHNRTAALTVYALFCVAVVTLIVLVPFGLSGSDSEADATDTVDVSETPATEPTPVPEVTEEADGVAMHRWAEERRDLIAVWLDDHSDPAHGYSDVWIGYDLENTSDQVMNYRMVVEVVEADSDRKRVFSTEVHEFDVQPGDTAHGETFTTNTEVGVAYDVRVTEFERTPAP